MAHQVGDVLAALAQRRDPNRHHVQAIEEVVAEQPLADQIAQLAVGRGDDADVGLDRLAPAHRGVFALLQDPQQAGLGLERHVADLVQEEGPALGLLEAAGESGPPRR